MQKNFFLGLLIIAILAFGAYFLLKTEPVTVQSDEAIKVLVENFGTNLQNVDLSDPDAAASIASVYRSFLTAELLSNWVENPNVALGRKAGIFVPDRIEVSEVKKESDEHYRVEGVIVEVSSEGGGVAEAPVETARKPVSFVVELRPEGWRIAEVVLKPYVGDGNWILSQANEDGMQFLYPDPFHASFITPVSWPPTVELIPGEFSCTPGTVAATGRPMTRLERHTVGDRIYCVSLSSEGAAGSTYMTYVYTTQVADSVASVSFTLRFPQCLNYDEPNQSMCLSEQQSYDIDGLIDRITSSIQRPVTLE